MGPKQLREQVESLQSILIARATGGAADDDSYRALRDVLLGSEIGEALPSFVRNAGYLDQFWAFIRNKADTYAERRQLLWAVFNPILDSLERQIRDNDNSAEVVQGRAAVTDTPPRRRPPRARRVRVFISYSSDDKHAAGAVKQALVSVGFDCFLAHEDLQVSEEWKERILEELMRCEILVALLSKSFKLSNYAPQELGVIVTRKDVAIIPLSLDGTIPFGFISHLQGKPVPSTGLDVGTILEPLARRRPRLAIPAMVRQVREAATFRGAEAALAPLVPLYREMTDDELNELVDAAIENGQVWDAALCRGEYLPDLIEENRSRIAPKRLRALEYQINNGKWYPDNEV